MKSAKSNLRIGGITMMMCIAIGLSACSRPILSGTAATNRPSQARTGQETSEAFRFGVPVESASHALIAAEAGLGTGFNYTEPLTVVTVQQMTYGEYSKWIGAGSNRPADLKVWLVVYFDSTWQSTPSRPKDTPTPPFRGCVSVVINAADGSWLDIGGPLEKGKMAECDR